MIKKKKPPTWDEHNIYLSLFIYIMIVIITIIIVRSYSQHPLLTIFIICLFVCVN